MNLTKELQEAFKPFIAKWEKQSVNQKGLAIQLDNDYLANQAEGKGIGIELVLKDLKEQLGI